MYKMSAYRSVKVTLPWNSSKYQHSFSSYFSLLIYYWYTIAVLLAVLRTAIAQKDAQKHGRATFKGIFGRRKRKTSKSRSWRFMTIPTDALRLQTQRPRHERLTTSCWLQVKKWMGLERKEAAIDVSQFRQLMRSF